MSFSINLIALFFVIQNYKREIPEDKILKLFDDSIKHCFPELIDEFPVISPMSLVGQESKNEYGDYVWYGITSFVM